MTLLDDLGTSRLGRSARAAAQTASDRLDAVLSRLPVFGAAVGAVMVLQLVLVFTHRPWLDEWQALQLALQSPTMPDLLENLRYEGHPPLWYLLLRALGRFCDPLTVLPLAAALVAVPTQATIAFASPFRRADRLFLATGCLILFEFMTISRGATLGVGLLIAALACWRSRWVWLAIALLPMCDFLFGVLSGVLVILQWRDKPDFWRRCWPGVAAWAAVGGAAAWTVLPAPDMVQALELTGPASDAANYLLSLGVLLVPLQWEGGAPGWNGAFPFHLGGLLGLGFVAFAYAQVRFDRLERLLFWGFFALTLVFSLTVYPLPTRHLMLIAVLLMLLAWRRADCGQAPSPAFRVWLAVGSLCGLFVAGINLAMPFDTAHLAAAEIRGRGLAGKHWMSFPDSRAQGVSAITGIAFERPETNCMQTFVRWNHRNRLTTPQRLGAYLRGETNRRGRFYLLSDLPLDSLPRDLVQPIVSVPAGYYRQQFHLYVVGPGLPDTRLPLPLCVPNQRPLSAANGWLAGALPVIGK